MSQNTLDLVEPAHNLGAPVLESRLRMASVFNTSLICNGWRSPRNAPAPPIVDVNIGGCA